MPQARYHHLVRAFDAVHHAVEAIESAGIVARQVATQGVEALTGGRWIVSQLLVDGHQAGIKLGVPRLRIVFTSRWAALRPLANNLARCRLSSGGTGGALCCALTVP